MKNLIKNFKWTLTWITLMLLIVFSTCFSNNKSESTIEFNQQKQELIERLEKLKKNIDDAIEDVEDDLNINENPVERNIEKAKSDLLEKKNDVKKSLEKAKKSTN
jgi:cell division protein FtsB